jgi:hypothetical protein
MGKIKDWFSKRRQQRLMRDLEAIKGIIEFDPIHALGIEDTETSINFTKRIEEYRIWFGGNAKNIREMYANSKSGLGDSLNYFWAKAPKTKRMLHTGIPGLISRKMATILFGGGVTFKASVYALNEDGTPDPNAKIDEAKTKQAQDIIDNLIIQTNLIDKMSEAAQNESWSAGCFYKLSHDVSLSDYPILEITTVRNAEVVEERGIVQAIVFKTWIEKKNTRYRLNEIYTTNEDGDAVVTHKLYKIKSNNEIEEVDLEEIEEGVEVLETYNNADKTAFVYKGLKGILAFYKPNMKPSHEFPNTPYGASDYEGAIDSFDALDESYSQLISEIRDNQTLRYIPEDLIPREVSDDGEILEYLLDDSFVTNYVKIRGDADQDADNKIDIQYIEDKTESLLAKYRTALTTAINHAGLSPLALGITGLEAVNTSAESQQERNKTTLETRKLKIALWKPHLVKLMTKIIELNSWMQKNTTARQKAFAKIDLDFDNTDISVEFGEYIVEPVGTKINQWGSAKMQKVASTKEAVKNIHPDWSDEQIIEEVNAIKFEEGVTLDNPLRLTDLNEFLDKEEEKKKTEDITEDDQG